uniref:Leucine-zipper-like transcriptional regulator 1 n=1 Tax=Cacopsylla melanoneura TaxID=428564 RepID=A0A8D8YQK1_9HEMI
MADKINDKMEQLPSLEPKWFECFNSEDVSHKWIRMPDCDEFVGARRSKHTLVAYKDSILVFGGDNGSKMLNDLLRFDVKEKSWTTAFCNGTPPAPRYHHSAVVYNDSMFIFGGYTGDIHSNSNLANKNDLHEYKITSGQWTEWRFKGRMPVARSAHGAAVYDNKLWIFAGYDGNARLNDMWTISLLPEEDRVWEEILQTGNCPPTCCNFPVAVLRESMFVFSGQSGAKITNSLFQFNFGEKCWTRISIEHNLRSAPPPPTWRYGHTMVAHDRHLYVFGGAADSTLSNNLHCYDLDAVTWTVVPVEPGSQVPSGRLFHASAVMGDCMFVFGGAVENNARSGSMHRFKFSKYPKCTLHDDLGKLLRAEEFCDVEFKVGKNETRFLAHIAIVGARSKVLRAKILEAIGARDKHLDELFGTVRVPPNCMPPVVVHLDSAVPEAFQLVLNYVYTDCVDPYKQVKDPRGTRMMLTMLDVYRLAIQFRMPRLECLCDEYLRAIINLNSVLSALSHADELPSIHAHCLRYVIKENNFATIVESPQFELLDRKLIVNIVRSHLDPNSVKYKPLGDNQGTSLEQDLKSLLMSQDMTDIEVTLDGVTIPTHKAVLAARCAYFEAMFRSFMPAPGEKIKIQIGDSVPSLQSFHSLLRYIYYGEIKMPPEDSLYLFQAPLFYGFTNTRLQVFCKHNLDRNVTKDNVLNILVAAEKMNIHDVKELTMKVVVKNYPYVVKNPTIHALNRDLLIDILQAMGKDIEQTREMEKVQSSVGGYKSKDKRLLRSDHCYGAHERRLLHEMSSLSLMNTSLSSLGDSTSCSSSSMMGTNGINR